MSSGNSYQCSSMDDGDDELEGLSSTFPWKRNRKRKDYSDNDDTEEDEEEYKTILDFTPLATAPPSPIAVANVGVNRSLGNKRKAARIQTGGKVPRLSLASKNVVSTLIDRESRRTTQRNYPGEWDPKKVSSPEWRPSKETVEKNLMEKLGEAAKEFEKAYNLMMKIVGDLEDHYYEGNKKEERKF